MSKKHYKLNGEMVSLFKTTYVDGTLAVVIIDSEGETYGVATVNLKSCLQSSSLAFVDENNLPGIGQWLTENGVAQPMNYYERSGFCMYPLYTFLLD